MRDEDAEAWERFVFLYSPLIHYWCTRGNLGENDASDLTQTILAQVAEKLRSFDASREGSTFRGWLRVMTRNRVIDFYRQAQLHPKATGGTAAQERLNDVRAAETVSPDEESRELSGLYQRAVELMKVNFEDRTWQSFWMSVVEERTTAEVCELLGLNPGSVRMARHRVLRLLREQLSDLLE